MNLKLFRALTLCALLFAPCLCAQEDTLFYLPDMEAELFNTEELEFGRRGTFDKSGLVAALVRIASDFDPEEKNGKVPKEKAVKIQEVWESLQQLKAKPRSDPRIESDGRAYAPDARMKEA